jgi:hypothetical protein
LLSLGGEAGGDGGSSSIAGADYAADDDCVVDGRRCLPWCVHGFIIIYHYFVFVFISGGFFVESLKIQIHTISTRLQLPIRTYDTQRAMKLIGAP